MSDPAILEPKSDHEAIQYIAHKVDELSDNPCPFCVSMDGTEAGVADGFVTGGIITDEDGRSLVLDGDYSDGSTPDAHANCQCVFRWQVDESNAVDSDDAEDDSNE